MFTRPCHYSRQAQQWAQAKASEFREQLVGLGAEVTVTLDEIGCAVDVRSNAGGWAIIAPGFRLTDPVEVYLFDEDGGRRHVSGVFAEIHAIDHITTWTSFYALAN